MLILPKASMAQVQELMAGRVTYDKNAGARRCKEHKGVRYDLRPLACSNCSDDLKDAITDMLSVIRQYKGHFRAMQRLLATAQPAVFRN